MAAAERAYGIHGLIVMSLALVGFEPSVTSYVDVLRVCKCNCMCVFFR